MMCVCVCYVWCVMCDVCMYVCVLCVMYDVCALWMLCVMNDVSMLCMMCVFCMYVFLSPPFALDPTEQSGAWKLFWAYGPGPFWSFERARDLRRHYYCCCCFCVLIFIWNTVWWLIRSGSDTARGIAIVWTRDLDLQVHTYSNLSRVCMRSLCAP